MLATLSHPSDQVGMNMSQARGVVTGQDLVLRVEDRAWGRVFAGAG